MPKKDNDTDVFLIEKAIDSINVFISKKNVDNDRYRSWEHCYSCFYLARKEETPDIDKLCLHLAFYLASWGMYRGSSFLLQKDYLVHEDAVNEIMKPEWKVLQGISYKSLLEDNNIKLLFELSSKLSDYYDKIRGKVKNTTNDVSKILITKILLGTFGCTPAYDRFFCAGIKEYNIASGLFGQRSIQSLAKHYEKYYDEYETVRKKLWIKDDKVNGIEYPQMKVLDMAFWQLGRLRYKV